MLTNGNLPQELKTNNASLPDGYSRVLQRDMSHIDPWRFIEDVDELNAIYDTMRELYTDSIYLPFARRLDNDDVACVIIENNRASRGRIGIVHLYASDGYELDQIFDTFWDWFRTAVNDMVDLLESVN